MPAEAGTGERVEPILCLTLFSLPFFLHLPAICSGVHILQRADVRKRSSWCALRVISGLHLSAPLMDVFLCAPGSGVCCPVGWPPTAMLLSHTNMPANSASASVDPPPHPGPHTSTSFPKPSERALRVGAVLLQDLRDAGPSCVQPTFHSRANHLSAFLIY